MTARRHALVNVGVGVAAVASLVVAWLVQTGLHRGFFGQDGAVYTMLGGRVAAGGAGALLWNGYLAPGVPTLVALAVHAGASLALAFHLVAAIGYATLFVGAALFARAVGESAGMPRAWATTGGLLAAALFCLGTDVLEFGTQPLTDAPALGALLLGAALVPRVAHRGAAAAGLGLAAAAAYLVRYVSLPHAGVLIIVAAVVLAVEAHAGRLALPRALGRLLLAVAPLAAALMLVLVSTRAAGRGFSYGANTMTAVSVAVDADRRLRPGADVHRVLDDDGTFGFYHADPAAPDAWNLLAHLSDPSYLERPREVSAGAHGPATLLRAVPRVLLSLARSTRYQHPLAFAVGAGFVLFLLVRRRREVPALWAGAGGAALTLAGALLTYVGESRYLWYPIFVGLAGLPPALWTVLQARSWHRTLGVAIGGLAGAAWLWGALLGAHGVVPVFRAEAAGWQATAAPEIERLVSQLAPRPDDVIAAYKAGQVLATGARWVPLAIPTGPTDAAALVSYLRRARARAVIVTRADAEANPVARAWLAGEPEPALRLVGEVGYAGSSVARVYEVLAAP